MAAEQPRAEIERHQLDRLMSLEMQLSPVHKRRSTVNHDQLNNHNQLPRQHSLPTYGNLNQSGLTSQLSQSMSVQQSLVSPKVSSMQTEKVIP